MVSRSGEKTLNCVSQDLCRPTSFSMSLLEWLLGWMPKELENCMPTYMRNGKGQTVESQWGTNYDGWLAKGQRLDPKTSHLHSMYLFVFRSLPQNRFRSWWNCCNLEENLGGGLGGGKRKREGERPFPDTVSSRLHEGQSVSWNFQKYIALIGRNLNGRIHSVLAEIVSVKAMEAWVTGKSLQKRLHASQLASWNVLLPFCAYRYSGKGHLYWWTA